MRVELKKPITITFFYPPLNGPIGTPVRWIPMRTPIIENYLNDHFLNLKIRHYDVELEIEHAAKKRQAFKQFSCYLKDYLTKHPFRYIALHSNSRFDYYFEKVLKLLCVEDTDIFCFSFYNRSQLGVKSHFMFMRFIKSKFPQSKVVVGGFYGYDIDVKNTLSIDGLRTEDFPYIDFYVPSYGERPMYRIVNSLIKEERIQESDLLSGIEREEALVEKPEFENFSNRHFYVHSPKSLYYLYTHCNKTLQLFNDEKEQIFFIPYTFQRGCFYGRCAYCGCVSSRFFTKDVKTIVDDLQLLRDKYKSRYFVFFNTNFNFNMQFSKELLREMIKQKLSILWTDSFNLRIMDDELIELLVKAGCFRLDIGVITFSEKLLRLIDNVYKDLHDLRWLKKISTAGLWTHINLIAGLPYEFDVKEYAPTVEKIKPFVDSYVLNKLRIPTSSRFAVHSEHFGIKLFLSSGQKFLENGFKGSPLERQLITHRNFQIIDKLFSHDSGRNNPSVYRMVDVYLLGYLYYRLGASNKYEIKKIAYNLVSTYKRRKDTHQL